jgi:integrase
MARTVKDTNLQSREARSRLQARAKCYFRTLEEGLHIGYRKPRGRKGKPGVAGKWFARHYIGAQKYVIEKLGIADDFSDSDGTAVLSFSQAQAKAREHMVKRAKDAAGVGGPLTVKTAVEAYLEHLESERGPRAAEDARHRAEAFILPQLGDVEVASLSAEVLRRWHAGLARIPARVRTAAGEVQQHRAHDGSEEAVRRRRSSANRTLTTLRAALNFAFREGRTASDAAWRKVQPFKGVDAARIRYLTVSEAKRLINASESAFRALVQAALQTGCRYGELTRLQVCDFNADSGTLAVRQSKSGKPRHVVLTDEGSALFRRLTAGRAGGEIMLLKANGEPWDKAHQQQPMAEACARAKIKPPISFHGLRHSWASLSVMSGMPLLVVAKNLGHSTTRMVESHYGHLAPSYVTDAVRAHAPRFGFGPDNIVTLAKVK